MTLGQFATAVGAQKRWVQNAFAVLGLAPRYTVDGARRLAFAKMLKDEFAIPLVRGYPLAEPALACWPARRTWEHEGSNGVGRVVVDLERFLSDFSVRLSLSRTFYAEKRRGRRWQHDLRGVALAEWYGIDVSLLVESLKLTPEERLRRLEEAVEFLKSVRVVE